jgi:hypothetical protein
VLGVRFPDLGEAEALVESTGVGVVLLDTEVERYAGGRGLGLESADDRRTDATVLHVGAELDAAEFDGFAGTADAQPAHALA